MIKLLTGKEPANEIFKMLKRRVVVLKCEHNVVPHLAVVRIGNDPASERYVSNKQKDADSIGIQCDVHHFSNMTPYDLSPCELRKLEDTVKSLSDDPNIHGIIVQLPFEDHAIEQLVIAQINPYKDVDGLTAGSIGARTLNPNKGFWPCTPEGIMELLAYYRIPLAGSDVAVVGRSNLVGQPLAQMLIDENATVTVYHSKSDQTQMHFDLSEYDIVCLCTGNGHRFDVDTLVDPYNPPTRQHVIIDAGISFTKDGKMIGDFNPEGLRPEYNASYTPVPGGIGLMTRALLMKHVIEAAERSATSNG